MSHHLSANVREEMNHAAFWIERAPHPDKVLVSNIDECNQQIALQTERVTNIEMEPETFSQEEVLNLIQQYTLPVSEERFTESGNTFPKENYPKIAANQNLDAIPNTVRAAFGIAIKRTVVRAFPTWETNATTQTSLTFDRFQETENDVYTPVCALHTSSDGQWVFCKTPLYAGWVPTEHIAWVELKQDLKPLVHPRNFLIATGSTVFTNCHFPFQMGTKIPLQERNTNGEYLVIIPSRGEGGMLSTHIGTICANADVHCGFLPYTTRNLLQQIFKMRGEPYSWGGRTPGRDCTRLILDTLRTFGIIVPRNSGYQRKIGREILNRSNTITPETTFDPAISHLPSGTFLYSDGHAMTYLGSEQGRHYIIHAFSSYQHIATQLGSPLFGAHVTDLAIIKGGIAAVEAARTLTTNDAT